MGGHNTPSGDSIEGSAPAPSVFWSRKPVPVSTDAYTAGGPFGSFFHHPLEKRGVMLHPDTSMSLVLFLSYEICSGPAINEQRSTLLVWSQFDKILNSSILMKRSDRNRIE